MVELDYVVQFCFEQARLKTESLNLEPKQFRTDSLPSTLTAS